MDFSNRFNKYRIGLIIILLVSIFLPIQRFAVSGKAYQVYLFDNYSTWVVIGVVSAISGYCIWKLLHNKITFWVIDIAFGSLLAGWVLFTFYHTITLFINQDSTQLPITLQASAIPGEGLLLLFVSSLWFIIYGIKNHKK